MKELWKSGIVVLLIIGCLYIIFLRECKHPLPCPAEDEIIIKKKIWDSIEALANKSPVIKHDTIKIIGDIVKPDKPKPDPKPDPVNPGINNYDDTLKTNDIFVWYNSKIQGTMLSREWGYRPIYTQILTTKILFVPKIVNIPQPYPVTTDHTGGLYAYMLGGGNSNSFLYGGGLDLITKKNTEIGYLYQKFGDVSFHSVKLGVKIKLHK